MLRLPLLPTPFLDEAFGSWFERSAESYHMESRDFATAILRLDGHKLPRYFDLDCDPPTTLIAAVAKYSHLRRSELEFLVVRSTGALLPATYRDAYCPQCFDEDKENGAYYRRRPWLDAWTLVCERHGCMLGRFDSIKFNTGDVIATPQVLFARRERPRRNACVVPVRTPSLLGDDGTHANRFVASIRAMLKRTAGRDLLLHFGSAAADVLYFELTGIARPWNRVWHDVESAPLWPPTIEHPLGSIETRLNAAYVASYLWDSLYQEAGYLPGKTSELSADELRRSRFVMSCLPSRWCRADRDRLSVLLG